MSEDPKDRDASDPAAPHESHAVAPPPEPRTPMWLPALGAALFLAVGLWWAITSPPAPPSADSANASDAGAPEAGAALAASAAPQR